MGLKSEDYVTQPLPVRLYEPGENSSRELARGCSPRGRRLLSPKKTPALPARGKFTIVSIGLWLEPRLPAHIKRYRVELQGTGFQLEGPLASLVSPLCFYWALICTRPALSLRRRGRSSRTERGSGVENSAYCGAERDRKASRCQAGRRVRLPARLWGGQ